MPIEITVPRLGWSMDEGTFSSWLKKPGDTVQAGEPLFALESDKVTMDVESLDSGILDLPPDAPQEGATVIVGQLIGYLLQPGEVPSGTVPKPAPTGPSEPAATPRACRVAAELGVDTKSVVGTGKGGRVRERDVRAAATEPVALRVSPAAPATPILKHDIPLTPLRRAVAMRMMEARNNTVPVTLTCRVDATNLVQLRKQLVCNYTDAIVFVAARALKDHPVLAGRWAFDRITIPNTFDIGVAVDTPRGLLVPVIPDAANLTLRQLTVRSKSLIDAARNGTAKPEDLQGSCFTVSNLGAYDIEAFTPVINYPETAVLGVGAIALQPVVLADGQIAARHQLTLSLTFDHRVTDGAPAARFLQSVKQALESADLLKLAA